MRYEHDAVVVARNTAGMDLFRSCSDSRSRQYHHSDVCLDILDRPVLLRCLVFLTNAYARVILVVYLQWVNKPIYEVLLRN